MANHKVVPLNHPMCKEIQLDTKDLGKRNIMNMEKTDSPNCSFIFGPRLMCHGKLHQRCHSSTTNIFPFFALEACEQQSVIVEDAMDACVGARCVPKCMRWLICCFCTVTKFAKEKRDFHQDYF
jgi:hypothetical protein